MRGLQITLSETDYNLLTQFLETEKLSEFNKKRLTLELKNARVVKEEYLPLNIVGCGAKVVVWNMDKNQTFTVHLVLPHEVNGREKISIYDPIALALIGYPTGAVTLWEMPDGLSTFKIVSVSQINTGRIYA